MTPRTPAHTPRQRYCRKNDLPGLIALWPHEFVILNDIDHAHLLHKLKNALRAERRRGIAGHWSYNLARHTNLLHAYRMEVKLYKAKWGKPWH